MRRVRLDEDDLKIYLTQALGEQGYIKEGHEIIGFEYKTRTIKRGGSYYYDVVKDGEAPPPEGVEVVKWIKVLIGPPKKRDQEHELDAEAQESETTETDSVVE